MTTSFKEKMKAFQDILDRLDAILDTEQVKSLSENKKVILFFHVMKKFPSCSFLDEIVKKNEGDNNS